MRTWMAKRVSIAACLALVAGLLFSGSSTPVAADSVQMARGYAYGISENALPDPNVPAPEAVAEVPTGNNQEEVRKRSDRPPDLVALPILSIAKVEADACMDPGVSAKLQSEINFAHITARGDTPTADDNAVNDGPNDEDPARQEVVPDEGQFPDRCVRPLAPGEPRPVFNASPSPGATGATASPSASASPSATPTPTATPTSAPTGPSASPTGTPPPNCEEWVPPETAADPTTCMAALPLHNARGYSRAILEDLVGIVGADIESEAVARCENSKVKVATGARFGLVGGILGGTDAPNTPLSIVEGSVVTFWETNWDPKTNTTTDGSETVWVNGLHIITPTEEIIVAHSEATAECPAGAVPAGGFPRDINLSPSKGSVLYGKTFTLSGAVTPATEFQTPRSCVEGVTITLRRDVIGGAEEFVDIGSVVTDTRGNFTFNYQADRSSQWLAHIDKDNPTDCALSTSAAKPVLVKPFVRLLIRQKIVRRGDTVNFKSQVDPCTAEHVGTRIKLKRQFGASMVEVDTARLDQNCQARFTQIANYNSAVYQAAWPKQDEDHQTGKSRRKVVRTR
ncbi:MAG TPA: hypothetical protein VNC78_08825 [Actinomycetota bacterium]|nr:hypothetical protein [Actinomycetota bacterium]